MKLCDLLEFLTIGQRYAKKRVLSDIADVLGVYLGLGSSALEKIARNDSKLPMRTETKSLLLENWNKKEKELLDYFEKRITNESSFASAVGIAKSNGYKKRLLCKAVSEQFKLLFDPCNTSEEIRNIIPDVYSQLLESPEVPPSFHTPLYSGDEAQDFSKTKYYTTDIYGSIVHEFEIQNRGQNIWENRRLVYVDESSHVYPVCQQINIPETGKNGLFKFFVEVKGRGAEGMTKLRWKMVDANDSDCFPSEPDKFCFTVETKFHPQRIMEVQHGYDSH